MSSPHVEGTVLCVGSCKHQSNVLQHNGCLDFAGVMSITLCALVLYVGFGSDGVEGLSRSELLILVGDETKLW